LVLSRTYGVLPEGSFCYHGEIRFYCFSELYYGLQRRNKRQRGAVFTFCNSLILFRASWDTRARSEPGYAAGLQPAALDSILMSES
jgi:hypothetical protein